MIIDTIEGKRPSTKVMSCPACKTNIEYWYTSVMSDCAPHFYCNRCSNVIWRAEDRNRIREVQPTSEILEAIEQTLPPCPCGGNFKGGANPKCPKCGVELKHQSTAIERLSDPHVILIEGASFLHEEGYPKDENDKGQLK